MIITIQINAENPNSMRERFTFSSCTECPFCVCHEETEYGELTGDGWFTCGISDDNNTVWEGCLYEGPDDDFKPVNCPIIKVTSSES